MSEQNNNSNPIVNVNGNNNHVTVNIINGASKVEKSKKKAKKSWLKTLGKLIHSIIVKIAILFLEAMFTIYG